MLIRKSAGTDGSQSNYLPYYLEFQNYADREDMRKHNGVHFRIHLNTERTLLDEIGSKEPLKIFILLYILSTF